MQFRLAGLQRVHLFLHGRLEFAVADSLQHIVDLFDDGLIRSRKNPKQNMALFAAAFVAACRTAVFRLVREGVRASTAAAIKNNHASSAGIVKVINQTLAAVVNLYGAGNKHRVALELEVTHR